MILSVVLAVVFYSFVILAVGYVLNPEEIALSQSTTGLVTADAMAKAFGTSVMAKVIIVGGMCGIVTSWNSFMMVVPVHCILWQNLTWFRKYLQNSIQSTKHRSMH